MHTVQVGEFKAHFSEILKQIQEGQEFIISDGKNKKELAALIPYEKFINKQKKIRYFAGQSQF